MRSSRLQRCVPFALWITLCVACGTVSARDKTDVITLRNGDRVRGVAMGGDLKAAPKGKSPTFLVAALKDPIDGNLYRIQIIKGRVGKDGNLNEKIFDVVWGDAEKRKPGANGKLPPVGNSVNVAAASYRNSIGDPELIGVWKDPEFDPALRAFYDARVLEIPTPRWTAYDAAYFKVKMDPKVPMVTQERATTSPIWYTPGAAR